MTVITRFAPSPTGYLHIGGARTALFNYLYAKKHGGKFLLRIEDTDKARSSQEATDALLDALRWLGLDWDGPETYQSHHSATHKAVAERLVAEGNAYYCYTTPEELKERRESAAAEKKIYRYAGDWRNRDVSEAPQHIAPVIRLKVPENEHIVLDDHVQGKVSVHSNDIEDFVILRADGTPTYMLAAVADDHESGVNMIMRGDDHLTNTFKQLLLYRACGWDTPSFSHIPLIHGPDGAKLSKRHGALGAEQYRDMGYLPEAMCNYLLRLGWAHGDTEIIDKDTAIGLFSTDGIGKSPSRFDIQKLNHINAHYLKEADDERLYALIHTHLPACDNIIRTRIINGMTSLKQRAKTVKELAEAAAFYIAPQPLTDKAAKALEGSGRVIISAAIGALQDITDEAWLMATLEEKLKILAAKNDMKLGATMGPIRAAITGSHQSPSMFEAMEILGKTETLQRLKSV